MSDINTTESSCSTPSTFDIESVEFDDRMLEPVGVVHSYSAPQISVIASDDPSTAVSSKDRAKMLVLLALIEEFGEWLASLANERQEFTARLRRELERRMEAVAKLREHFDELARDMPSTLGVESYEAFADRFREPYDAVIRRAEAILADPKAALSVERERPTSSRAELEPSPLEAAAEDPQPFDEFARAIERYEKACDELNELYKRHVPALMNMADAQYVRASKGTRARFFRSSAYAFD